ncbi:MAG: serine hydrolase [Gammaproteobacteria bacterium]|nr:serine hydrolase [Gammaproteobacteria bacterium]
MQGFPVASSDRVPLEDWDRAPWNRWSFQHVREIVPTAEVWRGTGEPWNLPQQPRDFGGIEFRDADGVARSLADFFVEQYTDGLIVLHRGAVVHESYHNGMTPRSLHLSQSVAKSVTACVAGALVGRGLLDPAARITDYLPELEATAYRGATLRNVLDMSSGVRYVEDYEALDSHIAATDIACGWKPPRPGFDAPACIWDQILTLTEADCAHGERFNYRSIETDVIAHCMERVSETRLPELISRELWQPLGCEESACFTVDPAGYALACGGLNASLRDYARVGLMLANGGYGNGRQIVPAAWIEDTLTCDNNMHDEERKRAFPNGGYRNQLWLRDVDTRVMMARGVFGQLIYADPDRELTVIILSSWPEFTSIDRTITALNLIDAIAADL